MKLNKLELLHEQILPILRSIIHIHNATLFSILLQFSITFKLWVDVNTLIEDKAMNGEKHRRWEH